jgi:hypothetical protein
MINIVAPEGYRDMSRTEQLLAVQGIFGTCTIAYLRLFIAAHQDTWQGDNGALARTISRMFDAV